MLDVGAALSSARLVVPGGILLREASDTSLICRLRADRGLFEWLARGFSFIINGSVRRPVELKRCGGLIAFFLGQRGEVLGGIGDAVECVDFVKSIARSSVGGYFLVQCQKDCIV